MSEVSHVQWFPGHMAKTRRIMASNLKLVDAVVEITDARIPFSSRNPEMKRIVGSKPRLVLLNKADSADPEVTAMWLDYYAKQGITALATDCRSGKNVSKFYGKLKELLKDDIEKWNAKGMSGRPVRIMIVGIPNVGKSSFINRLAGSRLAKVEDRPGVTRGKQWVKLDEGFWICRVCCGLSLRISLLAKGSHLQVQSRTISWTWNILPAACLSF